MMSDLLLDLLKIEIVEKIRFEALLSSLLFSPMRLLNVINMSKTARFCLSHDI